MQKYTTLERLVDAPYVIRVVLRIDEMERSEQGFAMGKDFNDIQMNNRIIMDVIGGLQAYGIAIREGTDKGRRFYQIRLTEKGKELAAHLRRAVDVFNEAASDSSDRTGSI